MKQTDLYAPFLLHEAQSIAEINNMSRAVEATLATFGIYLNTDDFNTLHDFISATVTRIREDGA